MANEKIEEMFLELKSSIDSLSKQFNKRFDEHERQQKMDFENMEERFNKRFKEYEEKFNKRFDTHEDKQRLDFSKLEYVMYDRTKALFDAREISLENDEKLDSRINLIDKILERYYYRILELESKPN